MATNITANTAPTGDSKQHISITDIICEGPIHGLVKGSSSVYFNNISSSEARFARYTPSARSTITFASSTGNTGYLDDATWLDQDLEYVGTQNPRVLWLRNYLSGEKTVSAIDTTTQPGMTIITVSGTTLGGSYSSTEKRAVYISLEDNDDVIHGFFDGSTNKFYIDNMYATASQIAVNDSFTLHVDQGFNVDSIDVGGSVTVTSDASPSDGSYNFYIGEQYKYSVEQGDTNSPDPGDAEYFNSPIEKVDKLFVQERKGWGKQRPMGSVGNVGGATVIQGSTQGINLPTLNMVSPTKATSLGVSLFDTDGMPNTNSSDDQAAYPGDPDFSSCNDDVTILDATNFGLDSAAKIAQCDKIGFFITYNSFTGINQEKGLRVETFAFFDVRFRFKRGGTWESDADSNWVNLTKVWEPYLIHRGKRTGPTSFEHIIDLEKFRPFEDFELRIARVSRHEGLIVGSDGSYVDGNDKSKRALRATAQLVRAQSYTEDIFNYPYTALVNTSFSSKTFSSTPKRSYDIKGKLVKIPSTYTTREESNTGIAKYDDFWDGTFKDTLEYTDNPAWIFYDLVTNNRYGAGKYISEDQIDKYALYRISKYCDELVDTGFTTEMTDPVLGEWYKILTLGTTDWNSVAGTTGVTYSVGDKIRCKNLYSGIESTTGVATLLEPRFRMNLYLSKATQVYTVLKDLASAFTSMLYWLDGAITLVQDTPQDAVYTFTKGNVLNGRFNYESTSNKVKFNQIVVVWNDPQADYSPQLVVVEDSENIAQTGVVTSSNVVSMGTTSESQAIRYGKWKLWTSQNQLENITFKTALQGVYIKPGDIINVQDADRYGISYSGRVSSVSSDLTSITFDRSVDFNSASTYELSVVHTEPTAIYVGNEDITINSVIYSSGDRLPEAYVWNESTETYDLTDLDTEERAINAALDTTGEDILPVVWKKHTYAKTYEIDNPGSSSNTVSLSNSATFENTVHTSSIWGLKELNNSDVQVIGSLKKYRVLTVAMENKNEYAISAVEHYNEKFEAVEDRYELGVVPPTVYPELEPEVIPPPENPLVSATGIQDDPFSELTLSWDAPETTFNAAYEISSNILNKNLLRTSNTSQIYNISEAGKYTFRIRTISPKGNYSKWVTVETTANPKNEKFDRIHGLPKGVYANYSGKITGTSGNESFDIEKFPLIIASVASPGNPAEISESSGGGSVDLGGVNTNDTRELYLILDHSEERIFLAQWDTSMTEGPGFWRDLDDGTATMAEAWDLVSSNTGTITANTNKLIDIDTTNLQIGDVLNLSDTVSDEALVYGAVVESIIDTTSVYLDRTFDTTFTDITVYKTSYRPDTTNDAVIGLIKEIA